MSAAQVVALPDCAERLDVACNAAWEIESLASLLQRSADSRSGSVDSLVVRGLMMRVRALADVVTGAVDDAAIPLSKLEYRLSGCSNREGGEV